MKPLAQVIALSGLVLAGAAFAQASSTAGAKNIPTLRLLEPSDVTQVSLSPSSSRVAGLFENRGQTGLLVLEWKAGALTPILATHLEATRSITGYRWLTDDYLLLGYEDSQQNLRAPVIADIPHRDFHYLPQFSSLVKVPWGDKRHALFAQGGSCGSRVVSVCLVAVDLANGNSQRISDPLPLLPAQFLVRSEREVYASGRDVQGMHKEYRLDSQYRWREMTAGTFTGIEKQMAQANAPAADVLAALRSTGINDGVPVFTAPGHHLVGLVGRAPQIAFVAVDPRMDGIQTMLEQKLPAARVEISGLNDSLTRGLVRVWSPDQPPRLFFLNDGGGLNEFTLLTPRIDASQLGHTHFERAWTSEPVSVTLPPSGIALIGAMVDPYTDLAANGERSLHTYSGDVQTYARQGIAVVRLLVPLPGSFASNAAAAAWRADLIKSLGVVVQHTSDELLHGGPVCLFGTRMDGELALAAGALPHVGCIVAVNAVLDPKSALQRQDIFATVELRTPFGENLAINPMETGPPMQMVQRELPGVYGMPGGQLADAQQWVGHLPPQLLLVYARHADIFAQYANHASAFRAAAAKRGTNIDFYAPDPGDLSPLQDEARLVDAIAGYVHRYFSAASTAAVAITAR